MQDTTLRQKWSLTEEAFHGLLTSLDPDPDAAANRYLAIRRNLVRLFEWRGCATPEEFADETLNRCARKIGDGEQIRDPATYCVGIARMLLLETSRVRARSPRPLDRVPEPQTPPVQIEDDAERRLHCLRHCLSQISPADRDLILHYYQGDGSEKINNRKGLTQIFSLPAGALRMRALRLREKLHSCTESCLKRHTAFLPTTALLTQLITPTPDPQH